MGRVRGNGSFAGPAEQRLMLGSGGFGVGSRCGRLKLAPGASQFRLTAFSKHFGCPGDRREERCIRPRVPEPGEQRVEIRPRRVLRREVRHVFGPRIDTSFLFSIMSITRQSAHIIRRRVPPANIEWEASRPTMLSIICMVPNGLPQRTKLNGSA